MFVSGRNSSVRDWRAERAGRLARVDFFDFLAMVI
jgi:hypothetical protein